MRVSKGGPQGGSHGTDRVALELSNGMDGGMNKWVNFSSANSSRSGLGLPWGRLSPSSGYGVSPLPLFARPIRIPGCKGLPPPISNRAGVTVQVLRASTRKRGFHTPLNAGSPHSPPRKICGPGCHPSFGPLLNRIDGVVALLILLPSKAVGLGLFVRVDGGYFLLSANSESGGSGFPPVGLLLLLG